MNTTTTGLSDHTRALIAEATGYALDQITAATPSRAAANLAHIHRAHGRHGAATATLLATDRALTDGRPLTEPDDTAATQLLHDLCRAHGTPPPVSAFACLLAAHRHADRIRDHLTRGDHYRAHLAYLRHAGANPRSSFALTALAFTAAARTRPQNGERPAASRATGRMDRFGFSQEPRTRRD